PIPTPPPSPPAPHHTHSPLRLPNHHRNRNNLPIPLSPHILIRLAILLSRKLTHRLLHLAPIISFILRKTCALTQKRVVAERAAFLPRLDLVLVPVCQSLQIRGEGGRGEGMVERGIALHSSEIEDFLRRFKRLGEEGWDTRFVVEEIVHATERIATSIRNGAGRPKIKECAQKEQRKEPAHPPRNLLIPYAARALAREVPRVRPHDVAPVDVTLVERGFDACFGDEFLVRLAAVGVTAVAVGDAAGARGHRGFCGEVDVSHVHAHFEAYVWDRSRGAVLVVECKVAIGSGVLGRRI
ncbi:hypothetical protein BU23DRAFT_122672, partial [Bimuria novae-zelandiae CBS 107.79]